MKSVKRVRVILSYGSAFCYVPAEATPAQVEQAAQDAAVKHASFNRLLDCFYVSHAADPLAVEVDDVIYLTLIGK